MFWTGNPSTLLLSDTPHYPQEGSEKCPVSTGTDANPNSVSPEVTNTGKIQDPITDTKKIQNPNQEDTPRRGKVCSPSPNQVKATSCHTKTQSLTNETDVTKSMMSQDTS